MAQQQALSKLKFRIVYCSGEETEYPVVELLTQSPQSKGWQSPKYTEYPQEIAFQFLNPVRVRQVQFLSHQCKIASKIELYVYIPDGQIPFNNQDIKYKKLGYLSLDTNEKSGFQARELKSVYLDTPAQYLKLVLHQCHTNKYNLFNQIGLIAVSVFGEPLNAPGGINQQKAKEFFNEIQYETQFDKVTLEKLRALEEAKERAVKNEDFLEAGRIKEAVGRLKQIGMQLRQLEERKIVAIENEDFDSANIIKKEIEKLRNAVVPESMFRQEPPPQTYQKQSYMIPQSLPTQNNNQYEDQQYNDQQYNNQYDQPNMRQQQYNQQKEEFQQPTQMYREEEAKIEPSPFRDKSRLVRKDQEVNHDEQIIPAIQNRGNKNKDEYEQDGQNNQNLKVDNFSGENMKLAEPLIPILTEECCKMLFSKAWSTKEEGLKWLENQIALPNKVTINPQDFSLFFTAVMGAISFTINDRIAAVYARSLSTLQVLLQKHFKLKVQKKGEFNEYLDNTIQGVMEKLGDNNPRIKEQAEAAMKQLADHPSVGSAICVGHLIKGITAKPKLEQSIKHLNGRLVALHEYVKQFGINNANMPYQPIVDFTVKQLDHQNEGIRTSAIFVLVEIYKNTGERLRHSLSNVRPAQMEILEKFFQEINGGGNIDQMIEEQKMVVSTHIEHQGQGMNTKAPQGKDKPQQKAQKPNQKQQAQDHNQDKEVDSSVCQFCEVSDRNFKDSTKHDIHLWKECPMLTNCSQCAQVVEISGYTIHLLEECEQYRSFKRCPRCKEAIHIQNYDKHVEEKGCQPAKPTAQANRCPLCHTDIKPHLQGWKLHLIQQGCPNNERTAG